jgi:hypothetical protein
MPVLIPTAVVSSTILDLKPHRREVEEACKRQGVHARMMEYLPASDATAIKISLDLVDQADIYIGVFAHRYGHIPAGMDKSITEMEYDRAVARGIPRLIFIMHEEHPILRRDVQCEHQDKLRAFLDRIDRVAAYYRSPDGLRAEVIDSLSHLLHDPSPEVGS